MLCVSTGNEHGRTNCKRPLPPLQICAKLVLTNAVAMKINIAKSARKLAENVLKNAGIWQRKFYKSYCSRNNSSYIKLCGFVWW